MRVSAKQMLSRLQIVAQKSWLENQVRQIVLSDQKNLKEEKINEFEQGLRPAATCPYANNWIKKHPEYDKE